MNATYPHYSMDIRWSDEDQAFIVTVPELPGCKTHGFTYEEAVDRDMDRRRQGRWRPAPHTPCLCGRGGIEAG